MSGAVRIPEPIGALVARLPQWPPSVLLAAALNMGLRRELERQALERLRDKVIRLELRDGGIRLTLTFDGAAFRALSATVPADVTIAADVWDFGLLALRKEDPDALFFARRLVMEGDTELGLVVRNMLDALDTTAVGAMLETPIAVLRRVRARLRLTSR
jgi:predicted lipid carrier protein YhbT